MLYYKYKFHIPKQIFLRRCLEYLPIGKRSWINNSTDGSNDVTSVPSPSVRPPKTRVNRSTNLNSSHLLECDLAIHLVNRFIEHLNDASELVTNKSRYLFTYLTNSIEWLSLIRIVTMDNERSGITWMHLK